MKQGMVELVLLSEIEDFEDLRARIEQSTKNIREKVIPVEKKRNSAEGFLGVRRTAVVDLGRERVSVGVVDSREEKPWHWNDRSELGRNFDTENSHRETIQSRCDRRVLWRDFCGQKCEKRSRRDKSTCEDSKSKGLQGVLEEHLKLRRI